MNKFRCISDILGWCHTIIPTIFDDSLSYGEMVMRLKALVHECIDAIRQLSESNQNLTEEYQELVQKVDELQNTINEFINGMTIPDGSVTLQKLADDVMEELRNVVAEELVGLGKFVMFGLTDDGYFCVDIPQNWEDVTFDTDETGNLVLEY